MECDGISIGNPLQLAEYSNNNNPPCLSGLYCPNKQNMYI